MHKILLGEDEEFVARSYVRKLQVEGFEVIHAHNGEEALKFLLAEKPDLVILDLMMPLKTGFEVLQELKGDAYKAVRSIPIIVASNLGQKSDIDTALSLGAIDFLVKSNISLKELVAKVREHLPSA
jgi:two-component system, OmpR family, alkaline phosphatase synthesis response regulator PhoP